MPLELDDLDVGMTVTVESIPPKIVVMPFGVVEKPVISEEMGVPFTVKAVDLPFVILKPVCGEYGSFHLDTRFYKLKRCKEAYVDAFVDSYRHEKTMAELRKGK